MKKNSKQRLFEIFERIDPDFGGINEIDNADNVIERYVEKLNNSNLSMNSVEDAMDDANKYLEGYGVETITDENEFVDNFWRDAIGLYINMGDTYEKTIVYDTKDKRFLATSWGDFVNTKENFFGTESEMDEADLNDGTDDDTVGNSSHDKLNAINTGDDYVDGVQENKVENISLYDKWKNGDSGEAINDFQKSIFSAYQKADAENGEKLRNTYPDWFVNAQVIDNAKINEIGPEMGSKAFQTNRPDSRTRKIRQDVLDNMFGKYINKPELPLLMIDRSKGKGEPIQYIFNKVEMRGVGNGDIFAFSFTPKSRDISLTLMYSPSEDKYLKNIDNYEFNPQMVNLLIYNAKLAKKLYEKISGNVDNVDSALTKNDFKMYAKY